MDGLSKISYIFGPTILHKCCAKDETAAEVNIVATKYSVCRLLWQIGAKLQNATELKSIWKNPEWLNALHGNNS